LSPADTLERWPQVCCLKITFTSLPLNHSVSTTTNSMKCRVNWIALRIRVCFSNTQPRLNRLRKKSKQKHVTKNNAFLKVILNVSALRSSLPSRSGRMPGQAMEPDDDCLVHVGSARAGAAATDEAIAADDSASLHCHPVDDSVDMSRLIADWLHGQDDTGTIWKGTSQNMQMWHLNLRCYSPGDSTSLVRVCLPRALLYCALCALQVCLACS